MTSPDIPTPEMRVCAGCGYQWPRGQDGRHECEPYLLNTIAGLRAEVDRLRKEVERLREDKDRLDWLSENVRQNEGLAVGGYWYRSKLRWQETRLRAAIDAAMYPTANQEKQ